MSNPYAEMTEEFIKQRTNEPFYGNKDKPKQGMPLQIEPLLKNKILSVSDELVMSIATDKILGKKNAKQPEIIKKLRRKLRSILKNNKTMKRLGISGEKTAIFLEDMIVFLSIIAFILIKFPQTGPWLYKFIMFSFKGINMAFVLILSAFINTLTSRPVMFVMNKMSLSQVTLMLANVAGLWVGKKYMLSGAKGDAIVAEQVIGVTVSSSVPSAFTWDGIPKNTQKSSSTVKVKLVPSAIRDLKSYGAYNESGGELDLDILGINNIDVARDILNSRVVFSYNAGVKRATYSNRRSPEIVLYSHKERKERLQAAKMDVEQIKNTLSATDDYILTTRGEKVPNQDTVNYVAKEFNLTEYDPENKVFTSYIAILQYKTSDLGNYLRSVTENNYNLFHEHILTELTDIHNRLDLLRNKKIFEIPISSNIIQHTDVNGFITSKKQPEAKESAAVSMSSILDTVEKNRKGDGNGGDSDSDSDSGDDSERKQKVWDMLRKK